MKKLMFFDSTLRDGSHAIAHQFTADNIRDYCSIVDNAGLHTIIVGHGNGLGASSLQVGLSKLTDEEMICIARETLTNTKLGAYMIPGFGTIDDDLKPAIERGLELICVGTHCTEADVTRQHIEYARSQSLNAYGVLMMYHMASTERILEEAYKLQEYGAMGIIIMDSAGASTPELVKKTISTLVDNLDVHIGFHPHNNLGLAVGNAYIAIHEGASIIDATTRGLGAGAGNCQMEALIALLERTGLYTGVDLYKVLDASEKVIKAIQPGNSGLSDISIVSGMSGVFSSFATQVKKAAKQFDVDPRDIFIELGKRKVVGGQEDFVVEIAIELAEKKKENEITYQIESLL
jgi:4-hydroxy 2-oxovalerate aldolase